MTAPERWRDWSWLLHRMPLFFRAYFSTAHVQHLLRYSPSVGHAALDSFDDLLRIALSYLTNCDLSDSECIQASLPVRDGALVSEGCVLSAFFASAASIRCLRDEILLDCYCWPDDTVVNSYITLWSAGFRVSPIEPDSCMWWAPVPLTDPH